MIEGERQHAGSRRDLDGQQGPEFIVTEGAGL